MSAQCSAVAAAAATAAAAAAGAVLGLGVARSSHSWRRAPTRGNKNLHAMDEDDSENAEESAENEEDLQHGAYWKGAKVSSGRK